MSRRLGQHFLLSKSIAQKAIAALDLKPNDLIIEIGAGHGELTREFRIQNLGFRVIAIEKDELLATDLRNKIYELGIKNADIITGDALKLLKSLTVNLKSYKLVGNIPYYITGHLLRIISELENKPELCVFTIQKEVAERICAGPPRMNRLSASVQFWATPEIIANVSADSFRPKPKVESAIMRLMADSKWQMAKRENYYKTVKILFAQPRKTILNNIIEAKRRERPVDNCEALRNDLAEKLAAIGINSADRPQNLTVENIKKIAICFWAS